MQRYINTAFWSDKWIRTLDPSERYLYLYLLTNPMTNIAGVYQITIDRIAFDTGYDERTLRPMLDRFEKAGKAVMYRDEWVIIPAWPKHQNAAAGSNVQKGIDRVLESLPDDVFAVLQQLQYQYEFMKGVRRPSTPLKALEAPSTPFNYSTLDLTIDSKLNSHLTAQAEKCASDDIAPWDEPREPTQAYPLAILAEWQKLGDKVYQPEKLHFLNTYARDIAPAIKGVHSDTVLGAIRNFSIMLASPESYWSVKIGLAGFLSKHLEKFTPANFSPGDFKKRDHSGDTSPDEIAATLEKIRKRKGA